MINTDGSTKIVTALLTKTELEWLAGNHQVSKLHAYRIRSDIKKKLSTFSNIELPLLTKAGFIHDEYGFKLSANAQQLITNPQLPHENTPSLAGRGVANPSNETGDIRSNYKEDGAGSGTFAPPFGSVSNPRVLSDMGLAIPRPARLGDPRPQISFRLCQFILSAA